MVDEDQHPLNYAQIRPQYIGFSAHLGTLYQTGMRRILCMEIRRATIRAPKHALIWIERSYIEQLVRRRAPTKPYLPVTVPWRSGPHERTAQYEITEVTAEELLQFFRDI
ncbi:hypothetical protein GF380_03470, partial [Candidatus Uhrbacteria bacterium]|nr:hypothetical protein [Candidatus Uhrbacteria bacterium]MBD3284191.1 hypothetical protein [Candidatus Uhrbacteria bacterium]